SYHQGSVVVDKQTVQQACEEVMQFQADIYQQDKPRQSFTWPAWGSAAIGVMAAVGVGWAAINYMPVKPKTPMSEAPVAASTPAPLMASEQLTDAQRDMLLAQKQSNLAVNDLYRLWGYRASVRDNLCLSEPQSTMRCERKMATWPLLMQQNRPVILELNYQGDVGYVILYAVGNDQVEVLNGKQRLRLPVSWLKPMWQGNIIELWQAPLKETLRLDMEGPA
ncbi:general secretion pathway protein GspA, partial [Vibrio parahaemolyticus]|nr:general secretion pathway protein GspA [Vibrio parahaemolyticus]